MSNGKKKEKRGRKWGGYKVCMILNSKLGLRSFRYICLRKEKEERKEGEERSEQK